MFINEGNRSRFYPHEPYNFYYEGGETMELLVVAVLLIVIYCYRNKDNK